MQKGFGFDLRRFTFKLISAFFLFLFHSFPVHAESLGEYSSVHYPGWVKTGGKFGNDRQIGILDIFVPVHQNPMELWFANLKGKDDSGPEGEWNIGLGRRALMRSDKGPWILSFYGFFDHLESKRRNTFLQGSFGAEVLTQNWDFRVNAYFPEGGHPFISSEFSDPSVLINGNTIQTLSKRSELRETALPGFDAEVGFKIPHIPQDIRVYGGGFYFDRSDARRVAGPRFRTEWRIEDLLGWKGARLTLDGEVQHDDVRDWEYFFGVSIRIPLDFSKDKSSLPHHDSLEYRMIETLVRDLDVVTVETTSGPFDVIQPAINPLTGKEYSSIYFAEEGATGSGMEADPASLSDAITQAGIGGVVVALDSGGIFSEEGTTLLDCQTLIGSNGDLRIMTSQGLLTSYHMPGVSTAIADIGGDSTVLTLANQNVVSDVNISGGSTGISGVNIADPFFINVTSQGNESNGVNLINTTNIFVLNSSFDNNLGNGFFVSGATGQIQITRSSFGANGQSGVVLNNIGDVFLTDVMANGNASVGLGMSIVAGSVSLRNSIFDQNTLIGISIGVIDDAVVLNNVTANSNGSGLSIGVIGGDVLVDDSSFSGNIVDVGAVIALVDGNVTLRNTDAFGNNGGNLQIGSVDGSVSVSDGNFSGSVAGIGTGIDAVGGNVTLQNVTSSGNNGLNLLIDSVGGNVLINSSNFNNSVTSFGAFITDVSGSIAVQSTTVSGNANFGLSINPASGVSVSDSTIDSNGGTGLSYFNIDNSLFTVDNNTITNNTTGIELGGVLTVGGGNNTVNSNGMDCNVSGAFTGSIGFVGGGSCP